MSKYGTLQIILHVVLFVNMLLFLIFVCFNHPIIARLPWITKGVVTAFGKCFPIPLFILIVGIGY
jgi:hypothetical protein